MKLRQFGQKVICRVKQVVEEKRYREIASRYDINGYQRIYLLHIRKTGGTSLNNIFLSLSGEDPVSLYSRLANTPDHRLLSNGKVFVGWNVRHINRGNYFYGFSHTPLHKLNLTEGTFTVTCFRDPSKRVISHYNMLTGFRVNNIDHPCMVTEGKWLGNTFDDFLQRIPQEHLLNQLYMFSAQYNVDEAVANVEELSHYFFTERFGEGIDELSKKTGLSLEPIHTREANYSAQISETSLANLKEMLGKEYIFLDRIQELQTA